MPALDATHLTSRLVKQIERLRRGEALIVRDVTALLTEGQVAAVEAEWAAQKVLRSGKRPRNDEERAKLGFKDKRELYIEALQSALAEAKQENVRAFKDKIKKVEARQARIYLDTYFSASKEGKSAAAAMGEANNELTRARLKRLDGTEKQLRSRRDDEVAAVELDLENKARLEMTDEERLQQQLLEHHLQPSKLKKAKGKVGKVRK